MLTVIFWKKVWSWIKHYWYFPVIMVLLLLLSVLGSKGADKLFDLMLRQSENHKKEIELLNETSKEKKEATDKVLESHKEALEKIEKDHELKVEELKANKKEEVAEIIKKYEGRPDDLAREVAKILSAEFLRKERGREEE